MNSEIFDLYKDAGPTTCPACSQKVEIADVIIIGAGAAGIAVALSLIQKVRQGWGTIENLIMIDKSDEPGTGLAYGSAEAYNTVLDRMPSFMSIAPGHYPKQFEQWVARSRSTSTKQEVEEEKEGSRTHGTGNEDEKSVERCLYGQYLKFLLRAINQWAWDLGMSYRLIRQEVTDIDPCEEGWIHGAAAYRVTLEDGCGIHAKNVVLALGNHPCTKYKHLSTAPNYFPHPWPTRKLEKIPKDATVGIIGTNASAIDVVRVLHLQGHRGSIHMMSRKGLLPSVESPSNASRTYPRAYVLHTIARRLEKRQASLEDAISKVKSEIRRYAGIDLEAVDILDSGLDALTRLKQHIAEATSGKPIKWQQVVDMFRTVAERYWIASPTQDKFRFLRSHSESDNPFRNSYRPTMLLENAGILEGLLQKDQLRIVKGGRVRCDEGTGFVMGEIGSAAVQVEYLVEATGLEYRADETPSTLLLNILRKGLIKPDQFGGIRLDIPEQLRARPGVFMIGSLTKGSLCFVENIDRIVAHSLRLSETIVGMPPSHPIQLALLVDTGSSIFSLDIVMQVVPRLLEMGHAPFVFFSRRQTALPNAGPKDRLYYFSEHMTLQKVIIPCYRSLGNAPSNLSLINGFKDNKYGILVEAVDDLNDPGFIDALRVRHLIDIGVVIGTENEIRVDSGIRRATFPMYNLKPGLHPEYQTVREVILDGGNAFGYSLHYVGEVAEDDHLVSKRGRDIESAPCAWSARWDCRELGAEVIVDAIDKLSRGLALVTEGEGMSPYVDPCPDSDKLTGRHFTSLYLSWSRGFKTADESSITQRICDHFASTPEVHKVLRDKFRLELLQRELC